METLTEEQLIFLATHTKRLRHCFNLASQHEDDADAAVIDLQHNAFADIVGSESPSHKINANSAEEPTPRKQWSLHSQSTSGTNGGEQNLQKAARKLYKAFCRECYAHFTPPVLEEEPLSQSQITYLLPATLFSMYLESASPAELRLLKVLRKNGTNTVVSDNGEKPEKHNVGVDAEEVIKERTAREVNQVIAHKVKEAVDSKQRECDLVLHALKTKIVDLEAIAATLHEREEKVTREKGQLELKLQRISDELSAVSRRYQFLLNKQNEDRKGTSEKHRGGGLNEKEIIFRASQSQQDQQQKPKTAAIGPPPPLAFGKEDDEDDLLIPSPLQSTNLGNAPPCTKNEDAKTIQKKSIADKDDDNAADDDDDDVTLLSSSKRGGKKKKGACAKCGKASGERYQCQRCKLRFHEICGGPYAREETDLAPELMDRIVDSENEAVIKFLTEDSEDHFDGLEDFTTSQLDFHQIDEMRNRRLCQLYCRVCRREQGIISDGSSSAEESEDDDNDDDGWSTDSSDVREREEKAALDVSRFPPTQYDDYASDQDGDPDVISISSETSSQLRRKRRAEKKNRKEEKQKRKENKKKLGRKAKRGKRFSGDDDGTNCESSDSFIVGGDSSMDDDSDDNLLSRRSKFVLMEAREVESDTDDEDEDKEGRGGGGEDAGIVPEEGLQRHKKETANRLIKANHKRKRGKGEGSTRNKKNSRANGGEEDEEDPIENSSDEEVQSSSKKKNNTAMKRKPVLDQNDLDVLDILGLEAPLGTKIEKSNSTTSAVFGGKVRKPIESSSSSSACPSDDDKDENSDNINGTIGSSNLLFGIGRGIDQFAMSPSGTTRDDAVQISQSTAGGGGVSPSRDLQSANRHRQESGEGGERRGAGGRGIGRNQRSHEIFETLRHGNQSQSTGLPGPEIAVNRALGFAAPRQRQATVANGSGNNSTETATLLPHADEEDAFWGNDSTVARTGVTSTNSNRLLFSTSRNQNNVGNKKGRKRTF